MTPSSSSGSLEPLAAREAAPLPEGEEPPPTGTRTAGVVRWALVAVMALAAAGTWIHFRAVSGGAPAAVAQFHCPMHPTVLADHAGACPICGMDLVAVAAGSMPAPPAQKQAEGAGAYWCPMHPEVTSDDPNATCSKCGGMKLLPRPKPEGARAGVPGLAPIDLSPERIQLIGMRTAPVARERLAPAVRTVGFVTADEGRIVIIAARFTGWIERVLVSQSGQRVRKGDPLLQLYSPDLDTAQRNYLNSVRWIAAHPDQPDQNVTLERDARARLKLLGVADQDVDELRRSGNPLRTLSIRSPSDGYVGKKSALAGLYVQPGVELFEIANLSRVWVIADVYESEMDRVRVGQEARLTVPAIPGREFHGRVAFLYPSVSTGSRTLKARIELENRELRLRPGMFANVTLELGAIDGLAVPAEAVVDTGEVQYLFVSREGGRLEPRLARLGVRGDGKVQVLEGVSEGERVVTTANFLVDSESRLRAAVEGLAGPRADGSAAPASAGGHPSR